MGPAPGSAGAGPDPVWERRHPGRAESWSFDYASPDGSLGGFVGLTIWPAPRLAWYWAALVGRRRPYLLVRDLDVAPPRSPASREIRSTALWADINCETPHDHWSLGLEAFGVSMDDPDDALGEELGDRVGLGLDLEWEASAPVVGGDGSYAQACAVHGEILVGGGGSGTEKVAFDGFGWRGHAWGAGVDWFGARSWVGGRLDTGAPYSGCDLARGAVTALHRAPLRLALGDRRAVLERSLCRFRNEAGEGGLGWCERILPS